MPSNQIKQEPIKHTPTPWEVSLDHIVARDENGNCTANGNESVAIVYGPDAEANAVFIVRAVNNHDAREKLLNTSLDLLMDLCESRAIERFSAVGISRIRSHIADLRFALSAAQEQSQK